VVRALIVSVKYAIYSTEHLVLVRTIRLSPYHMSFILIFDSMRDNDPANNFRRIEQVMEYLHIEDKEFQVSIYED
jgi:hypothetical protein